MVGLCSGDVRLQMLATSTSILSLTSSSSSSSLIARTQLGTSGGARYGCCSKALPVSSSNSSTPNAYTSDLAVGPRPGARGGRVRVAVRRCGAREGMEAVVDVGGFEVAVDKLRGLVDVGQALGHVLCYFQARGPVEGFCSSGSRT
ncbi:ATP phosphoribosyltransferase regulatory subunit [Striga asiatica]|uniref:ATP phosphoribosyltransferase regulatory subunit n=1 Tax=Striga asiatica TaxID=4170 RepID=A0A5A7PDP6_STRAF|nr:ATP phosphoribosyltransferase regulatory subunit [Striga asiatica]